MGTKTCCAKGETSGLRDGLEDGAGGAVLAWRSEKKERAKGRVLGGDGTRSCRDENQESFAGGDCSGWTAGVDAMGGAG